MGNSKFFQQTLSNGLTLLGEINPNHQSASIGFFVKTGSRDEATKESGVSHFLEHMMFKGTPKRNALELTYAMGNIGAQANAFTSEENTVYYGSVVSEYLPEMQEILCDMLRPSLDVEEFTTEKKVILEEIALYQDRPNFYLFEHAQKDYFGEHPAGNSVLGSVDSIQELSRDEMKSYFDRRYSPSNMILAASGRFDWKKFVADAEKYCGSWIAEPVERKVERHQPKTVKKVYKKKNIQQSHILLMSSGPSAQDEIRFELGILANIIGDSTGSRLYWALLDTGLADGAGADCDEKDGTGCFSLYASASMENFEKVKDIVKEIAGTPRNFSDEDVERAKAKVLSRVVLGGELPMGRLMSIGTEWIYRSKVKTLAEICDRIKKVSKKDIHLALERFPLDRWGQFELVPE